MQEKLLYLLNEAQQARESKNFDTAINVYEEALSLPVPNDDKAMLFVFIGQCYDKQDRERLAFEHFGKAFEADPKYEDDWYLFYRYAELAYKFRKFGLSIEYLEKVANEIPPDHEHYILYARRLLGNNFLALKDHGQALTAFKEALKIAKNSRCKSYIYDGIAHAYFGLNKIGKTIRNALKALGEEYDEVV